MLEIKTLKDNYFNQLIEQNKSIYEKALAEFMENLKIQLKEQYAKQYNNKDYIRKLDEECKLQQIDIKKQKERDAAREKREKERKEERDKKYGVRPDRPKESFGESMENISLIGLSKLINFNLKETLLIRKKIPL